MEEVRRVIVAGGRDFGDRLKEDGTFDREWHEHCKGILATAMYRLFTDFNDQFHMPIPMTVLSGTAKGADTMGADWAVVHWTGLEEFPADWDRYGKSAGYRRNEEMAKSADTLVAFWDGQSKGTKHMIDIAVREGLEVHVYRY